MSLECKCCIFSFDTNFCQRDGVCKSFIARSSYKKNRPELVQELYQKKESKHVS